MHHITKKYWKSVPANKTVSVSLQPSDEELHHVPARACVLDVGCGDGQLAELLAQKEFSVFGIDINHNAIEANINRNSKVHYRLEDITEKTSFVNNQFELICFKYTLANIHREEWPAVRKEVERLLTSKGFVWLAEPLVSNDYQERYDLSDKLLKDPHAIFVFNDPQVARTITTIEQLQEALLKGKILRISRHFKKEELIKEIFPHFEIISQKIVQIPSPSGFILNTLVALLQHRSGK